MQSKHTKVSFMEHKHKLLDSESCDGEGVCRESTGDRFSDLAMGVANHIVSFLYIRDLIRFSSVSKRCRELSMSTPSLNFDLFLPPGSKFWFFSHVTCEERLRLLNSLDRFLLRRGDTTIQHFHLVWDSHFLEDSEEEPPCFCVNENFRILTWIKNAVRCNVEELHVQNGVHDFDSGKLAFPLCVFLCATLRSLVVDINFTIVKTPSFAFSSNLEYLELRNVDIEEDFFKWISCSCKFIKEIHLCDVRKIESITIESSSLEKFYFLGGPRTCHLNISGPKLEDIEVDWRFYSRRDSSLNIDAPNLKNLCWRGNGKTHADLGKLECLEQAAICMEPDVDDSNNLFEAFCSLNRVEVLVLNEAAIKALFREEGSVHAQLDDLYDLCMDLRSFTDELVPVMVSILKGMPNLCTLYISYCPSLREPQTDVPASGFDMEYWKMQNLSFICQLEEVTIELSNGSNGVELARYILEHAESLEEMVIIYLPQQSDVIKTLNESTKISKATVTFQENQDKTTMELWKVKIT